MAVNQSTPGGGFSGRTRVWLAVVGAVVAAACMATYFLTRGAPEPANTATAPVAAPPAVAKHIYSASADPRADIAAALAEAKSEHKRVILDFGGDWCGDCQVLDIYFHREPNAELLKNNFVLVHVWIGQMDRNLDVAAKYGVPINKGVPALAVLDANGRVVYAQASGEFEDMRHMDPQSVTEFLTKWKS